MTRSSRRLALGGYAGILFLLCSFCAALIAPFFTALFMGVLLAGCTAPIHQRLSTRLGRGGAAAATTLLTLLLFIVPLTLVLLGAAAQGRQAAETLADENTLTLDGLTDFASKIPGIEILGAPTKLKAQVSGFARAAGKTASGELLKVAAALPGALLVTALTLLALFFGLRDGPGLAAWASKRVPLDETTRIAAWSAISETAVQTVWATLAAATAQALAILIGFLTLGIPMAFLAATATWIFAWIPFMAVVPWTGGLLYLIATGGGGKIAAWIAVGVVGDVLHNVARAWVLRGGSRLHPLVALVSIFGGVKLFGLVGVFIGPTIAAVTIALLEVFPQVRSSPQRDSSGTTPARTNAPTSGIVPSSPHAGTA